MTRFICAKKTYFIPPYFVRLLMILDRTTQASPNIAFRVWGRRGVTHKKTKVEDRAKNRIIEGHRFKDESSRKKTRHRNLEKRKV